MGVDRGWDELPPSLRIARMEAKGVVETRYLDYAVWSGLSYAQLPPDVRRKLEEVSPGQTDR